jgi:cellulose synthase/poly-beta-1,6-N-acetylglucosamine synthase-like glycosyltransferase
VARNEEAAIGRRVREFAGLIDGSGLRGEIIVVSDGSTDGTAQAGRAAGVGIAHVVELTTNVGKAAALSAGCAGASNDVLVFADARQTWATDALERLLENYADPSVGGAGGDLVVEEAPGVMAGVGLYWRFEKWLRRTESRLHSSVGLTGAICSVRRDLFRPIPPGTILDDVYWPLRVVMQGYRVVHDDRAHAFDRLPDRARDEFRRKVRTLSGNFQLVVRLPCLLLPWRNPIWWQFVSHKLARLVVPWALLGALGLSAALGGPLYRFLFLIQVLGYVVGLAGVIGLGTRSRAVTAASSFLVLNAAAWMAFWVWISGRSARSWGKVTYKVPVTCPPDHG